MTDKQKKQPKDTDLTQYVVYVGRGKYRIQPRGYQSKEDEYSSWRRLPRWAQQWFQYETYHKTQFNGNNVVGDEKSKLEEYEKDCEGSIGFRVSVHGQTRIDRQRFVLKDYPPWFERLMELPAEKFERAINKMIADCDIYRG